LRSTSLAAHPARSQSVRPHTAYKQLSYRTGTAPRQQLLSAELLSSAAQPYTCEKSRLSFKVIQDHFGQFDSKLSLSNIKWQDVGKAEEGRKRTGKTSVR